jgi:hypothetical protein
MKKNNSILEFSKETLSKAEKRNIIGGDRTNNNTTPLPGELDEEGNPINNSGNGDGSNPPGWTPPPPPPTDTSNN